MPPITTLTLFRFKGWRMKFWALSQMGRAPGRLKEVRGLRFFKLLGTGAEGFSTKPDWSVYGLLQVWDGTLAAEAFFNTHTQFQRYRLNSEEYLTLYMRPLRSMGRWNGINPFETDGKPRVENAPLAVITRATIRRKYLRSFWKHVPASQHPLKGKSGLIYAKGIGETPFVDMATFSLWTDEEAMKAYAYGTEAHQKVIRRTRELGWYKEELFARFQPYRVLGSWGDIPNLETFRDMLKKANTSL